jgi:transcriptional regulator with XRE-family HTH domain
VGQTLGEVLAAAREKKGFTLREVEKITGINNAHLSQIEKGTISRPAPAILWELSKAYDLDFSKLMQLAGLAGHGDRPARSLVGAALHTLGDIDDLTDQEHKELLDFMETLRRRRVDHAED